MPRWRRVRSVCRSHAWNVIVSVIMQVKTAAIAAWQEEAGASFGSVIPTRHGMFFRTILSASQLERVRAMTGVVEDAIPLPSGASHALGQRCRSPRGPLILLTHARAEDVS